MRWTSDGGTPSGSRRCNASSSARAIPCASERVTSWPPSESYPPFQNARKSPPSNSGGIGGRCVPEGNHPADRATSRSVNQVSGVKSKG
jgi:hypothetical protein